MIVENRFGFQTFPPKDPVARPQGIGIKLLQACLRMKSNLIQTYFEASNANNFTKRRRQDSNLREPFKGLRGLATPRNGPAMRLLHDLITLKLII